MKHIPAIPLRSTRIPLMCAVAVLLAILLSPHTRSFAQTPGNDGFTPPPTTSSILAFRPILVRIEFEGNSTLTGEQIQAQIQTRATHVPLLKRYFSLLVETIDQLQAPITSLGTHDTLVKGRDQLRRMVDSLGGAVRYLNLSLLAADVARIKTLYNDYGHHDVDVQYFVTLDTARSVAAVRFKINENVRYRLHALSYSGLEKVPADLRAEITKPQLVEIDGPFAQADLSAETDRVVAALRNNGYAFAASRPPLILIARQPELFPGAPYDSAVVFIFTGQRYHMGTTTYRPDDAFDDCTFSERTIMSQVEYRPGDWYSRDKVEQSVDNLYSLGTFDVVNIDTVAAVGGRADVLNMMIAGRQRSRNDFRGAPEIAYEQRLNEFLWSLGASASYTRLNAFCSGGHLSLAGRFTVPISNLGNPQYLFNRGQGGVTVSMLFPSILGERRLSLQPAGSYDNRVEGSVESADGSSVTMRSQKIQLQTDFTLRLPKHTFISSVAARLGVQATQYYGVGRFISRLASRVVSDVQAQQGGCDSATLYQPVYDALVNGLFRVPVLQGDDVRLVPAADSAARDRFAGLKQTIILGGTIMADHRDAFFTPTQGVLVEFRPEIGIIGFSSAGFLKGEVNFRSYSPFLGGTFAGRVHVGYIVEFGPLSFTPASSRFIAGGANSMRGWYERDMLATRRPSVAVDTSCVDQTVEALNATNRRLLGGLALIETSAEYRFKPFNINSTSTIAQQFNQLVGSVFVDAGNAFFRDSRDIGAVNILENIGVDVGVSLGYSTPVGPFRIGVAVPVYDPVNSDLQPRQRAIFNRSFAKSLIVHVGIGHAF